jgi:tRNA-2-methylthio-N6-dimethylallyladenosine synthase
MKKMGRGYSRSYYLDLTYKIREKVPDIALSSDFIVGFPGETEAHFEDTLEIIELVRYHQIYSFCYSERPSTPALKLEPKIDKEEKLRRLKILQEKQEAITSEWMEKMVGTKQKILIEGTSKTDGESSEGRTESNIPVHVRKKLEAGRIITVRIKRALKHSLEGEMTDE